jgi:hypothetical protein
MKCLKEPLSRLANRQDNARGAFFEERFKSVTILDEKSLLVDFTGRLFREGKAVISAELTGIFNRLGTTAETWQARLEKLKAGRLLGRFFAASRDRLREVAAHLGIHHVANLAGCPARQTA